MDFIYKWGTVSMQAKDFGAKFVLHVKPSKNHVNEHRNEWTIWGVQEWRNTEIIMIQREKQRMARREKQPRPKVWSVKEFPWALTFHVTSTSSGKQSYKLSLLVFFLRIVRLHLRFHCESHQCKRTKFLDIHVHSIEMHVLSAYIFRSGECHTHFVQKYPRLQI